jgi:peptide chain release factor 1
LSEFRAYDRACQLNPEKSIAIFDSRGLCIMAETYLLDKLKSVESTFHELTRQMADPEVATDPFEFQRVAKARSSLEEVVNSFDIWKNSCVVLTGAIVVFYVAYWDVVLRSR